MTGASGSIGNGLSKALEARYCIVGMDRDDDKSLKNFIECDLSSDESMELAFHRLRDEYGTAIAAVIHLAAYFDFTGEDNPLYRMVNVEGTRRLVRGLRDFSVERFIFSGTMLVHEPSELGQRISEDTPIAPKWPYPASKAAAEEVIREEHGDMPYLLLHLAGMYDGESAVPTLSHQIARIYEHNFKSRFYAGDQRVGQSLVHRDDLIDAFVRAVDRRNDLPKESTILIDEPDAMGYGMLQDRLGHLIHGEEDWTTITAPKALAGAAAWVEEKTEPAVPDVIDQGEPPYIRPFMVKMADDHYALDISKARDLLGWEPAHSIDEELPALVESLKRDPVGWYERNGITPPRWMQAAARKVKNPDKLRRRHRARYQEDHRASLWAHFLTMALGVWLLTSPVILGYDAPRLALSDQVSGCALLLTGFLSLSRRGALLRWLTAAIGLWVVFAPLVFWTTSAAASVNDTLVGALVIGFAVLVRPPPGVSAVAMGTGPSIPPGWDFSPSTWFQRMPIIFLAVIGFFISRYLSAYQLGHIDGVWDPFFAGQLPDKNGTEQIITSWASEAWPISDAGLGAVTYLLEILTGLIGSARRWRTMPWLVVLFGILIVPLGVVSITFIVIQPILIGTWCTLCLLAAAAMLIQIPYSLDELVATGQFLYRRKKAGANLVRIFFTGDTDEGGKQSDEDDFERSPLTIMREMFGGGVSMPWTLGLCILIGIWLLFTRLTLGAEGGMANADHLIGSLVLTVTVTALAHVARAVRFINMALGAALLITPFVYGADPVATVCSLASGIALICLSAYRGEITQRYGASNAFIF
ncbi:MAG TPA: vitamin K epoxide reductase family protein [Alphaproteobacteria bacterium]|nr:vitamin K epoxide reductase family protein [Alphaproteobacteria bacterium]